MRPLKKIILACVALVALTCAAVAYMNLRGEDKIPADATDAAPFAPTQSQIARGAYLARAGNCVACHTARGGTPYAGGLAIPTPFGRIYASNITPDLQTGIGGWSPAHFWRAMHNGRSRDGRLLYPAFPYTEFTRITREDSDSLFAYLRSLPPAAQPSRPHELRFPYNTQAALAFWRALYFEPGTFEPERSKSAEWNRGAYLVSGLGHCTACHSSRNVLGATTDLELSGGSIPEMGWYAPSLLSPHEAGVAHWDKSDIVALLKTGRSKQASTIGPMSEVVYQSTQFLSGEDLSAIATYLKDLQDADAKTASAAPGSSSAPAAGLMTRGGQIYEKHCVDCHGAKGEGVQGAYPALAGNRAVMLGVPANLIRMVLSGGYLPATPGNPRPYGMPPFGQTLDDNDVSAVLSYIRNSWDNKANAVSPLQVQQYRSGPGASAN